MCHCASQVVYPGGSVQKLTAMLQRWSGRHRSRLATMGLGVVLVLLAGFSMWAAVRTNAAERQG
jgi:hypothetical protein